MQDKEKDASQADTRGWDMGHGMRVLRRTSLGRFSHSDCFVCYPFAAAESTDDLRILPAAGILDQMVGRCTIRVQSRNHDR